MVTSTRPAYQTFATKCIKCLPYSNVSQSSVVVMDTLDACGSSSEIPLTVRNATSMVAWFPGVWMLCTIVNGAGSVPFSDELNFT